MDNLVTRVFNDNKQSLTSIITLYLERFILSELPTSGDVSRVAYVTDDFGTPFYDNGTDFVPFNTAPTFTVAELSDLSPSGVAWAYASNGRKEGELGGNGTGVPVWYDVGNGFWATFYDNSEVEE